MVLGECLLETFLPIVVKGHRDIEGKARMEKSMKGDEMVEKARAHLKKEGGIGASTAVDPDSKIESRNNRVVNLMASFARSAVRDALSEMDKFTTHGYDCSMHHVWNPANKHCDCGLSALRKKFEVDRDR